VKRNKYASILAVICILIGMGVLSFPKVSNYMYTEEVKHIKDEFERDGTQQVDALYKELQRRNEILYTGNQETLKDPFSYEQPSIHLEAYGLKEDRIGFITIPKLHIELPILLGANTENMRKGAVHLTETSYPIGGTNTNSVIAAHRGYSKADMFRNIEELTIEDRIYIQNFKETLTYKVIQTKVIMPTEVQALFIQEGKDLVTLLTCHPLGRNIRRYMVICERCENS